MNFRRFFGVYFLAVILCFIGELMRMDTNMDEHKSPISTREAAKTSGFSPRHIQKLIKAGKLSASRDEGGNYVIDKSEFYRVFPQAHTERTLANDGELNSRTILENEIRHLKEMLTEKNKQNDFLHDQLKTATIEKTMLLEAFNSNQKLLEHHSGKRKRFFNLF